jgi:hypothetical protein
LVFPKMLFIQKMQHKGRGQVQKVWRFNYSKNKGLKVMAKNEFKNVVCGSCGAVSYTKLDNGWFSCIWCDNVQLKEEKRDEKK